MKGGDNLNIDNKASPQGSFSDFAAYIPCYEGGNSVKAIKKDGQTILINKSIKPVLTGLMKENSIDIKYIRKNFCQYIGRTNIMPIPLRLGTVLIPVKVRKTIAINDGCYGYIDLSYIDDVAEDKNTVIRLKCGSIIGCLETVKTVRDRMTKGKLIQEKFAARMMGECGFKEGLMDICSEYDKAATKGDITMLAYEIMKLRNKME